MKTKILLFLFMVIALGSQLASSFAKDPLEKKVLSSLSNKILTRNYESFSQEIRKLRENLQCDKESMQKTLKKSFLLNASVSLPHFGPSMERRLKREINFHPIRKKNISKFIQGPLTSLKDQSVLHKGLSNLQFVLNSKINPEKKCQYMLLVLEDIQLHVDAVLEDWQNHYTKQFSSHYKKKKKSSHILINEALRELNELEMNYIALPFGKKNSNYIDLTTLPHYPLGISKETFLVRLKNIEELFWCGNSCLGLSELLPKSLNSKLKQSFDAAYLDLSKIASFENLQLTPSKIDSLYENIKSLNRTMQTELVTTLGVTVTFSDNDGD